MTTTFINFDSPTTGFNVPISLEDLRIANQLLERLSLDLDGAIATLECAAEIRPGVFTQTAAEPSAAVTDWNQNVPVGSPVKFWPLGRKFPAKVSRTASIAFDLVAGLASVLVEDYECAISLADVEPCNRQPQPVRPK